MSEPACGQSEYAGAELGGTKGQLDGGMKQNLDHGLFAGTPPPSREILLEWLNGHGAYVIPGLRIADMQDGSGWRLTSDEDLEAYDLLFSIPKTSVLSTRTSSLPPLNSMDSGPISNTSIFHLALCLLHEMRLGQLSPFYGYLQSLPRDTTACLLPMFWHLPELGGEDGRQGLKWLEGSEVERRMDSKEEEGLGFDDLVDFYTAASTQMPSTPSHPEPSPLLAFIHTYTLILTRGFVIDLYRPTALVPFADILNHSSTPHTSLASDDFVCHRCGSMGRCTHDILDNLGLPYRLSGTNLTTSQKHKMAGMKAREDDTVEMRAEREIGKGEDVWNSYGEIGDAGLLAEWGFIAGEYVGEGLIWRPDEVAVQDEGILEKWLELLQELPELSSDFNDDGQGLISPPDRNPLLSLSLSGQISFSLFFLTYLDVLNVLTESTSDTISAVTELAHEIEVAYAAVEEAEAGETANNGTSILTVIPAPLPTDESDVAIRTHVSSDVSKVISGITKMLRSRLEEMYEPDLSLDEILSKRDALAPENRLTNMAMTLTIDERSLLITTIRRWEDILMV